MNCKNRIAKLVRNSGVFYLALMLSFGLFMGIRFQNSGLGMFHKRG